MSKSEKAGLLIYGPEEARGSLAGYVSSPTAFIEELIPTNRSQGASERDRFSESIALLLFSQNRLRQRTADPTTPQRAAKLGSPHLRSRSTARYRRPF